MSTGSGSSKQRYHAFLESFAGGAAAPPPPETSPDLARRSRKAGRAGVLRRYGGWLRPHVRQLVLLFTLALLNIAVDLVWPLVSAYLVDHLILDSELSAEQKTQEIVWICLGMAAVFLLRGVLSWWRSLRLQLLSSRLAFQLRQRVFRQILHLPLSRLHEMKTGGLLSRLSTDVDGTTGLVQQALLSPSLAVLRLVATLSIVFVLNAKLAAILVFLLPPVMLVQVSRARRMRPIWRSMSQDRQDIDGRVSEGLSGVRVVRGFLREKSEERAYMTGHHTVIRKQLLVTQIQRRIATVWELLLPLAQLGVLGYGGYLVIEGQVTLGVVVAFQAYLWRLFEPISQIATSISATQRGLAAMDRVFELLDMPTEMPDAANAKRAPARVEELRFDHVYFGYNVGSLVLQGLNLVVPGGSMVALVGASGAGKTTLTDLVARFHDPVSGCIRLNGVDLREFRLRSYRSLLGVVSQEVFLFDGTIRDNIAYADPDATEKNVEQAARQANAEEFILQLPNGYNTLIGERGVKLSGGQRQRLSIARALLADPQILILDEATSNLDTESEQKIQASLQSLLKGRTTFVIAHRLSTITHADQIVVLSAGRTVEVGTHQELLALGGEYEQMVRRQAQETSRSPQ